MRDKCTIPAWVWLLWIAGLGVALYSQYLGMYGSPEYYHADSLAAEDMYRDLVERGGEWELWGLPGAGSYVELAMYFGVRFLAGNVHTGMAAFQTLMVLLFCLSALYASWPVLSSRGARYTGLLVSVGLGAISAKVGGLDVTVTLAHGVTVSAAVFSAGLLFRWVAAPGRRGLLAVMAVVIVLMSASDMLFVLYFCVPAGALLCLLWRNYMISFRMLFLLLAGMAVCLIVGKGLDGLLRNFPSHYDPFNFGFVRAFESLFQLLQEILQSSVNGPVSLAVLAVGFWGLFHGARSHTSVRPVFVFCLIAMVCTVLLIAVTGNTRMLYIQMWSALPCSVGLLYGAAVLSGMLHQRQGPVLAVLALFAACFLGHQAWSARQRVLPPYYPPLIAELDALAREKGIRSGLSGYWQARPITILSKENITMLPLGMGGHQYVLFNHTRAMLRDRVDMLLRLPGDGNYSRVDLDLEIRANGEPDEIIPVGDGAEVYWYRNGVHHPTEAELMLDGERLVPDRAKGDALQWRGELLLENGLTLTEARSAPRDGRHMLLLFFKEPASEIRGKRFEIYAVGDKLTRHRRNLAARWFGNGTSLVDAVILKLFIPSRVWSVTEDNCASLPDGGSVAWGKLPNWNSKTWQMIALDDGKAVHRLK